MDVEATKRGSFCNWQLIGSAGLRYGGVEQDYRGELRSGNGTLLGQLDARHGLEGIGPTLALETVRAVSPSLAVFALARGSLLFGTNTATFEGGEDLDLLTPFHTSYRSSQDDILPIGENSNWAASGILSSVRGASGSPAAPSRPNSGTAWAVRAAPPAISASSASAPASVSHADAFSKRSIGIQPQMDPAQVFRGQKKLGTVVHVAEHLRQWALVCAVASRGGVRNLVQRRPALHFVSCQQVEVRPVAESTIAALSGEFA